MKPKLFVPFNVRNKIINEDGNKKKDISKLAYKYNYSTLTSYMSEKKIYNAFIKIILVYLMIILKKELTILLKILNIH